MPVKGTQSLGKAIALLRQVQAISEGASFGDLQQRSSLPKSTLHRLLQSMIEERLLRVDPDDKRYRLGFGLLELAGSAWSSMDIRRAASPRASALSRSIGQAVHLAALDEVDIICIDEFILPKVRPSRVGIRSPAQCTAAGKAILAHLEERERERLLSKMTFRRITPCTPATRGHVAAQLKQVGAAGFAIEQEERELGTVSVAAPIFDFKSQPIAAIGIWASMADVNPRVLTDFGTVLMSAARDITRAVGGRAVEPPPNTRLSLPEMESLAWLPEGDVPC